EKIRGGVGVLEADGRSHRVPALTLDGLLGVRQDRAAILSIEDEIAAMVVVVRVTFQPGESGLGEIEAPRISRELVAGDARRDRVSRAVTMLGRAVERMACPVEQPEPAARTMIPHPLLEVAKAVQRRVGQNREVGEVGRSPGGGVRLPRLVLEHLELRTRGSPAMVEVA